MSSFLRELVEEKSKEIRELEKRLFVAEAKYREVVAVWVGIHDTDSRHKLADIDVAANQQARVMYP